MAAAGAGAGAAAGGSRQASNTDAQTYDSGSGQDNKDWVRCDFVSFGFGCRLLVLHQASKKFLMLSNFVELIIAVVLLTTAIKEDPRFLVSLGRSPDMMFHAPC